jgi:hypothetical protein
MLDALKIEGTYDFMLGISGCVHCWVRDVEKNEE